LNSTQHIEGAHFQFLSARWQGRTRLAALAGAFAFLGVPCALVLTAGAPEKYVYPPFVVLLVAFFFVRDRGRPRRKSVKLGNTVRSADHNAIPAAPLACRDAIRLISAYLHGELPPLKEAAVDSHLKSCRNCKAIFEAAANTLDVYYGGPGSPKLKAN
jgi:hypothetical protein